MRRTPTVLVILILAACSTPEGPATAPALLADGGLAHAVETDCIHFDVAGEAALGPVQHEGQWLFGAQPGAFTVGDYTGSLYSIVTGPLDARGSRGQGATHLTLRHVFQSSAGSFWTDDRAVCANAGSDPATCRINDQLQIVGGTGVFAGATGKFHNMASADFGAMTLAYESRGRVCAEGL